MARSRPCAADGAAGNDVVFGQVREGRNLERFLESLGELLLPLGLLAVAFFAAAWLVLRLRTRYRGGDDPEAEAHRMLTEFGDLRRRGGLSDEEFRLIKSRLAQRLDDTASKPPQPHQPEQPAGRAHDEQAD